MAQLPTTYNTAQLPEGRIPGVVIPIGDYPGYITKTALKPTKDNTGQYIELEGVITEPAQYAGHTIIDRINIINQNDQTVQIALGTIRSINEACSIPQLADTTQWHNIPMIFAVGEEPASGSYPAKNSILGYKPRAGNAHTTTAAPPATPAPSALPGIPGTPPAYPGAPSMPPPPAYPGAAPGTAPIAPATPPAYPPALGGTVPPAVPGYPASANTAQNPATYQAGQPAAPPAVAPPVAPGAPPNVPF